jgi:hypothetical protein
MELPDTLLPAGEYLIIDPCYIVDPARLQTLFGPTETARTSAVAVDPQTGARFAYSYTATGDGLYVDNDGIEYGVDSGTLACLPLGMLDAARLVNRPLHDRSDGQVCSGRFVTFDAPVRCVPCDAHGVIRFGPIVIDTGPPWADILADDEDDEEG